jgi:hypothetical protein
MAVHRMLLDLVVRALSTSPRVQAVAVLIVSNDAIAVNQFLYAGIVNDSP